MAERFDRLRQAAKSNALIAQIARFGVVGVIAAAIDWGVLALCVRGLGMDSIVSNVIAFLVSAPCNYWMSTRFVFDFDPRRDTKRLFLVFLVLAVLGLGINELVMWVGDKRMALDPLLVKITGIVLAAVFSFITRKLILEKREKQIDEERPAQ